MTTTLKEFEAALLATAGDANDELSLWNDNLLEEALRGALGLYSVAGPVSESSFTVSTAGYEQDISSLNPYRVLAIAWPWSDGYIFQNHLRRFRYLGSGVVRFDDIKLAANDVIRVQYHPKHTIKYLDGASSTTIVADEVNRFLLAAAHMLFFHAAVRAGMKGDDRRARLREISDMFIDRFYGEMDEPSYLEWGSFA